MLIMTVLAILFAAQSGGQNVATPGDQEIDSFLAMESQGKIADAGAMLLNEPTYRDGTTDAATTLPRHVFLEWLGHCRKGLYVNLVLGSAPDGTAGRAFRLECQKRGSADDSPYSEKIAFIVSSKGKGIEIR